MILKLHTWAGLATFVNARWAGDGACGRGPGTTSSRLRLPDTGTLGASGVYLWWQTNRDHRVGGALLGIAVAVAGGLAGRATGKTRRASLV